MSDDLIAEPMSDNEALRRIVASLDAYLALLSGQYSSVETTTVASITTADTALRAVDATAYKTIVTNTGAQAIDIYEGGALVKKALAANASWVSEGAGRLAISAKTASSTSSAIVSTYILLPPDIGDVKKGQADVGTGVDTISVVYSEPFESAPSVVVPQPLQKLSPVDADPPAIQTMTTSTRFGFTFQLASVTVAAYRMPWLSAK